MYVQYCQGDAIPGSGNQLSNPLSRAWIGTGKVCGFHCRNKSLIAPHLASVKHLTFSSDVAAWGPNRSAQV